MARSKASNHKDGSQSDCLRTVVAKNRMPVYMDGDAQKMAHELYIPLLSAAREYDREAGYFDASCFVVIASGLAGFVRNGGRMRLVMGIHNLSPDLVEADELSRERAEEVLSETSRRLVEGLDAFQDYFSRRRLEAVAYLLANGNLEIKVAVPKKTYYRRGNGIFHNKLVIFRDHDGCEVSGSGSGNETRPAYDENGENLTLHMSWEEGGKRYVDVHKRSFEALWNDEHTDYYVFSIPEAVAEGLHERYHRPNDGIVEPFDTDTTEGQPSLISCLCPIADIVQSLAHHPDFWHMSLGPVILYPHQAFTADIATQCCPTRVLLADEVGLGKTLEGGAIISRICKRGEGKRILILAPKNVVGQWQSEMKRHFGLEFWRLETSLSGRHLVKSDTERVAIGTDENPFEMAGVDFVVASWHLARGTRRRPSMLLDSRIPFDVVLIDEAHSARRTRELNGSFRTTRLYDLCVELSLRTGNLILVTATPLQLDLHEGHDLLTILGLGGPWDELTSFEEHYRLMQTPSEKVSLDEWKRAFERSSWLAVNIIPQTQLDALIGDLFPNDDGRTLVRKLLLGESTVLKERSFIRSHREVVHSLIERMGPMQWMMIRNTRDRLKSLGFDFPQRRLKDISVENPPDTVSLLRQLDLYLSDQYGGYEELLGEEYRTRTGFVRTIYHQRFASSLHAARVTLERRAEFLGALLDGEDQAVLRYVDWLEDDPDSDEEIGDAIADVRCEIAANQIAREAIAEELGIVRGLIDQISDDPATSPDPKLRKAIELMEGFAIEDGRKVIVFSKYTDTIDSLIDHLRIKGSMPCETIGLYTGSGAAQLSDEFEHLREMPKEDIVEMLESGEVRLMICSEAASEGLNLQAANVVINIDMPWNPAKVEQRIGRADRLGQAAEVVDVVNLYYPDSIEHTMYTRLLQRHDMYKLVIGPAQSIFSKAMRDSLDAAGNNEEIDRIVSGAFADIADLKERHSRAFLAAVGRQMVGTDSIQSLNDELVGALREFCVLSAVALGYKPVISGSRLRLEDGLNRPCKSVKDMNPSLAVGKADALTLAHPLVRYLSEKILEDPQSRRVPRDRSVYVATLPTGSQRVIDVSDGEASALSGQDCVKLIQTLLESARRASG